MSQGKALATAQRMRQASQASHVFMASESQISNFLKSFHAINKGCMI
jgi:hypothetical protein